MSVKLANKLALYDNGSRLRSGGDRSLHLGGAVYAPSDASEKKSMRWAVLGTIVFHIVLFVVTFPELTAEPRELNPHRPHYVVRQVRFKPPAPSRAQQTAKPKTRKIPIPDPTPDDPEPILEDHELIQPDVDLDSIGDLLDIPAAPGGGPTGPMYVKGDVVPPEKIYHPQPRYTEDARKARVQGVVILQAVIDTGGKVTRVRILKDLPHGLGNSAVETVQGWQFRPATLQGEPVPVYYNLTISFSLQ